MELANNKILITGATGGIGKAIAKKFLEYDNTIIGVGRNEAKLEELQLLSDAVIPFECDLGNALEREKLVSFIKNNHKDTNILINNAGIQYNYNFAEEQQIPKKVKHELDVNVYAPLSLIGSLLPVLIANKQPAIVNVSSGLAIAPKKQAPVYCGSKAAIHIFTKSLRYQLQDKGIHVFEVLPPLVDTEMTKGRGSGKISPEQLSNEFIKKFQKNQYEINIGKVKLLKMLHSFSPALADIIMKNGSES